MIQRILVSACLAGQRVRYDGVTLAQTHDIVNRWRDEGRLVETCPEIAGGLPVPRPAAEIHGAGGGPAVFEGRAQVVAFDGADVTAPFIDGARRVLELARANNVRIAVLKEGSPSCGSTRIYDGRFVHASIEGEGVTAALLRQAGIEVFGENRIAAADARLRELEHSS